MPSTGCLAPAPGPGAARDGRVVGTRTYHHQDLAAETYWDAPYTKDGVQIPGLPAHEGKGWLNDISPSSGVAVGTAMFPYGIPPTTPIDQAQIWPGSGPVRALPSLILGVFGGDPTTQPGAAAASSCARRGLRENPQYRVIAVGPEVAPITMCGRCLASAQARIRRMAFAGTETQPAVAARPLTCRKMPAPRPRTGVW